jgi:hypothetical protein
METSRLCELDLGAAPDYQVGASRGSRSCCGDIPSDAKYEESRRVPFVVLHDRLRRALQQPETLVIIAGYLFSDDDLNELIFDAARSA